MRLNPNATFDCLYVARRLQTQAGAFTAPELHLFAYLACLLWLYKQRAVADWGYFFVGSEFGAPFSQEIGTTVKELLERGYFLRDGAKVRMTEPAEENLRYFGHLALNQERIECLRAACASATAFSIGMVGSALAHEPELSRAQALPRSRRLLEEAGLSQLYDQFDVLRQALHQRGSDLRLPAVVWLAALYQASDPVEVEI